MRWKAAHVNYRVICNNANIILFGHPKKSLYTDVHVILCVHLCKKFILQMEWGLFGIIANNTIVEMKSSSCHTIVLFAIMQM